MSKKVKITVSIPEEDYIAFKEIANREGVSITHVILRSIKTDQVLRNAELARKNILIDDGKTMQRIIRM